MGIEERADRVEALALTLPDGLIVIDDAERIAKATIELVEAFRLLAPEARTLMVTRRALPIPGARLLELAPLAPAFAAQLLVARARSNAGLRMDEPDRDAIARIVEATGGLPQAIELAAMRLRVLSPTVLAAKLADERDGMLDRATDRALELASPDDVEALAALASFRGPFDSEEAETLLRAVSPASDAEARLLGLRDQSLLQRDDEGQLFVLGPFGASASRSLPPSRREALEAAFASVVARLPSARRADLQRALSTATEPGVLAALAARLVATLGQRAASVHELALLDRAQQRTEGTADALVAAKARAHARGRSNVPDAIDALRALVLACEGAGDLRGSAEALAAMAQEHYKAFRMVEARVAWERARQRLESIGEQRGALEAMHRLAALHGSIGQIAEAESLADRAASEATRLGAQSTVAEVTATLATIALQRGEPVVASARYADAAIRARALGMSRLEAVAIGYRAFAELVRGAPHEAAGLAAHAIELARAAGYVRAAGFFSLFSAVSLAELGRLEEAHRLVSEGLSHLDGVYAAVGDVLAGLVDLAEARAAIAAGEVDRAFGRMLGLTQRIARVRALRVGPGTSQDRPKMLDVSDDLRIVLHLVESRLEAIAPTFRERARRDGVVSPPRPRLGVAPGGVRFRFAGSEPISLVARPLLARLLWLLTQRALEERSVPSEDLVAAGWPDERLPRRTGKTRLYVALAELRKLGLRDVIESQPEGYVLAAEVELDLGL
jgi:tetratricopeptide (TPR) repeat protein